MRLINRHSPRFRRAALLALLGILLQFALPMLQPTMAFAAQQPNLRICSAEKAPQSHDQGGKVKTPDCPVCSALHHLTGGYVPPQHIAVIHAVGNAEAVAVEIDQEAPRPVVASQAQPRAPPILA